MNHHQPAGNEDRYDGPSPPPEGQVYVCRKGLYWKARKVVTHSTAPQGFFIVHMQHGPTEHDLQDSMVLGPREFAALMRERELKPVYHIV